MRARHSECSVMIGQNETEQAGGQQEQQQQPQQQQLQQSVQKLGTEKSTEIESRLSNGSLDPVDQDSAARVIDLQATLDKQVWKSITTNYLAYVWFSHWFRNSQVDGSWNVSRDKTHPWLLIFLRCRTNILFFVLPFFSSACTSSDLQIYTSSEKHFLLPFLN